MSNESKYRALLEQVADPQKWAISMADTAAELLAEPVQAEPFAYFYEIYADNRRVLEQVDKAHADDPDVFPLYLHPPAVQANAELVEALEAFDKAAKESATIIGFAGKALKLLTKARTALAKYKEACDE